MMDFDQVIDNTRKCVRQLGKLDIEDKYEEYSIDLLMATIKEEQGRMKDDREIAIELKEEVIKIAFQENFDLNTPAREYDAKLNQFKIYRMLRPFLKKLYRKFKPLREVDGRSLLHYNNKELIKIAYRSILLREVDEQALINAENNIKKQTLSRHEFLYNLSHSEEAKKVGIKVSHINFTYYKERCWKIIKRIPVVGYTINWIRNLVLLPNTIYTLQKNVIDIVMRLDWLGEENQELKAAYIKLKKELEKEERRFHQELEVVKELQENVEQDRMEIWKNLEQLYEREEKNRQEEQNNKLKIQEKIIRNQSALDNCIKRLVNMEEGIKREKAIKLEEEKKNKEIMDLFYLHYNEKLMPDSREDVEERQEIYLPIIDEWCGNSERSNLHMIDLGCGEGEFLELIGKHGYTIYGVDNNSMVIRKVKETLPELKIVEYEALEYLKTLEDQSVDFISSFHMVEHLEFIEIIELLRECYRVLSQNGLMILETPNPLNLLISTYYFYLDPTHKKPIPLELLAYFLEESGFEIKKIQMFRPLNFCPYSYEDKEDKLRDIVFRFNMEQVYSIMAVKVK